MKWVYACVFLIGWAGPAAASVLDAVNVYPNPVRPHLGDVVATFDNLPGNVDIKIFNAHGSVVREVSIQAPGFFDWELTNDAGSAVASGIYVYVLTDDQGNRRVGKLAVIR
jgi:hypothetical protein